MITCTVVLVTAAVILGFVLKNQVRENPDKNTVNVAIGQWGTTQNESQNYWNPDNHAVAKGMGGYYFIQTIDGISKIAFFDETTQEAVPVCAKPECTHSDNTCNAYLCDMKQTGSALYLTDTIYCYNGYLYLIQCEGGMGKLVRIHTDGSARETIADLFANTGVSSISLVFHENDVYAYDDTGHAGQEEEAEEVIEKNFADRRSTADGFFLIRGRVHPLTVEEVLAINYILLSGNIQRIRKPRQCHLIIKACLNMILPPEIPERL